MQRPGSQDELPPGKVQKGAGKSWSKRRSGNYSAGLRELSCLATGGLAPSCFLKWQILDGGCWLGPKLLRSVHPLLTQCLPVGQVGAPGGSRL